MMSITADYDETTERPNDQSPHEVGALLLAVALAAGLTVQAQADQLQVRGPRRAQAVAAELLANKAAVLPALAGGDVGRSVVSSFGRSRCVLLAADGLTVCADCADRLYGVAGFPPLCPCCLRERAGLPPRPWAERPTTSGMPAPMTA